MGALRAASAVVSGWPPGFGSSVQRGAQLTGSLCCQHRVRSSAPTVWPPSLAAQASVPPSGNINVSINRKGVVGLRPPLNGFTSPPPQPRCTGCARLAVAGSLLVPVLAIFAPCGPRWGPPRECVHLRASPARTRQTLHRPTGKLRNGSRRDNPGSTTKRVMAAAVAAAMMWRLQAVRSRRGGSVPG